MPLHRGMCPGLSAWLEKSGLAPETQRPPGMALALHKMLQRWHLPIGGCSVAVALHHPDPRCGPRLHCWLGLDAPRKQCKEGEGGMVLVALPDKEPTEITQMKL